MLAGCSYAGCCACLHRAVRENTVLFLLLPACLLRWFCLYVLTNPRIDFSNTHTRHTPLARHRVARARERSDRPERRSKGGRVGVEGEEGGGSCALVPLWGQGRPPVVVRLPFYSASQRPGITSGLGTSDIPGAGFFFFEEIEIKSYNNSQPSNDNPTSRTK